MNTIKFHFVYSALMFMASYAMTVRNLTTDQYALLAFKQQIIDPHNILANNWTTDHSVCNWVGVSCAIKHSRIKALNLSHMDLTGNIPPQLGNLSFLSSLNLSHNNLHGRLPEELGQLSRMKHIDISFNSLNGEIPSWLERLDRVVQLVFRSNNFTGVIPPSIANLSKLENLDLRHNLIHGSIPREISKHVNLMILRLAYNQLSDNEFTGRIPERIGECRNLLELELYTNIFSGSIPRSIGNLTRLRKIYLSDNNLEGEIPSEIGNLQRLEDFSARHMRLVGSIPTSLFNISSLKSIALLDNSLSGKLPDTNALSNLEKLKLWGNHLSGNIPDSISNVSKLKILDLSRNRFSGLIPNAVGNLQFLDRLSLWSNHLTTKPSIFNSLRNCINLRVLSLSFNPLNCILPATISNLSMSLQYFEAETCEIRGSIPMEIGSLNNAIYVDLSNNELSGSIPTTIGRLKKLQFLDFSQNKLQGSIPDGLCVLERLYQLSLASNELDGPLPTDLGDLVSLRLLDLSSNNLHSSIPSSVWSLKDILVVDLSSNYFNGSIPCDIENLKVITHLNLSGNLFSGEIPPSLGSLQDLQVLRVSHNRLQGPIPESLGDMMSLTCMDLSNNNLSGVIPKSLERLSYLKNFNVSFNRLEGEIPNKGCFMNFIAKSFMNNHGLCGSPTLHVQPCKNRRSNKPLLHALQYVLPTFGSVIVVAALVIVCKKGKNNRTSLTVVEELVPVRERRRISYYQLWRGTDGFNESNLLGSGSFGSVYKGILIDGMEVAVKVFNLEMDGAFRSFEVECEVMGKIVHRNLVKVITCSSSTDFKALVLEFMPNGSLEKWLYSDNHALDIIQRINIMIDVASALEYLHSGYLVPIIHSDLKPSNVLLDKDMVAHVGDFGIAKLLGRGDSIKQTITLATIGYMAPEYGSSGIISVKSDVYSYGILLMETFTRKKPTDEFFVEEMSLKDWVKMSLANGINGVGDSRIVQEEDEYFPVKAKCILSIMDLALECSAELPKDRIDMNDVLSKLEYIKRNLLDNIGKY